MTKCTLIPVKDKELLERHGIYFSPKTLRKWHSIGRHPQIFLKINRRLFIQLEKWQEIVKQKAKESEQRAKRFETLKDF